MQHVCAITYERHKKFAENTHLLAWRCNGEADNHGRAASLGDVALSLELPPFPSTRASMAPVILVLKYSDPFGTLFCLSKYA